MVPHRLDQRDHTCRRTARGVRLLLSGAIAVAWLVLPDTALPACELPARPGAERLLRFRLDPHESTVRFDADARLHTFSGTAGKLFGRIRLPSNVPSADAEACVQIDAASLTTGIDLRDARMRKSHLETDRFPTILFILSGLEQIEPLDADWYSATLRGAVTLHGVTNPLKVPAKARLSSTLIEVEGKVPLQLSGFQIPIPSFLFVAMKDEVIVSFKVKAVRE